jgi:fumarate hydratase class II
MRLNYLVGCLPGWERKVKKKGTTLKETAVKLGYVTLKEFNERVVPGIWWEIEVK